MSELQRLNDRIRRALAGHRGIQFSAADLDRLAVIGFFDILSAAEAGELKQLAQERIDARSGKQID